MSLKVLDILVKKILFGEEKIGYIFLNGSSGTTLKKFGIDQKYQRQIKNKNLLNVGNSYDSFTFDEYISCIQNGLSKDLGKKILLKERNLPQKIKNLLIKKYH